MTALSEADRDRLAKLLGLLGSDFAAKIAGYTHRPSEAQLVWLRDITERVLAGGVP